MTRCLPFLFLLSIFNWGISLEHYFEKMPKVELHLHLGGSYPIDYLYSIAEPQQKEALAKELERIAKRVPYHECFGIFSLIARIVDSEEKVERGVESLCRALEEDGVVYAEIRTGLKDFGAGQEAYLQAVIRGMQKGTLPVRLLLSLQRSSSAEYAAKTVDLALKYRDQGVAGIDLSGDSTIGEAQAILPEMIRAKNAGLSLALHMGESPKERGQRELLEALRPDRIGHGVYLEPGALAWIVENKTPIEVCLTSSLLVKMVDRIDVHPGLALGLQGHPIAICTDDPTIFQTSLSQEWNSLHSTALFPIEKLNDLSKNCLDHAFLTRKEKIALARIFIR